MLSVLAASSAHARCPHSWYLHMRQVLLPLQLWVLTTGTHLPPPGREGLWNKSHFADFKNNTQVR